MLANALAYVGLFSGEIIIIDPRTHQFAHELPLHTESISCLIPCKQNNQLFYSGSWDHTIKQWDLRKPTICIKEMMSREYYFHERCSNFNISNLYESNNGKKIFATDENHLLLWDVSQDSPQLLINSWIDDDIYNKCMVMNENETELHLATCYANKSKLKTVGPNCTFDELTR